MAETIDLAIIGAGVSGLACARTYIELHPRAKVTVFDAQASIGGVWSEERLYPGLKTNHLLGGFEFSDFAIDAGLQKLLGVEPGEHIPGSALHEYLIRYAKKFGVYDRICFNTKVEAVERMAGMGWRLRLRCGEKEDSCIAKRLIVSTGNHSQPFVPTFDGSDAFSAPLFHAKEFRQNADLMQTSKQIVVLGGTKSGWDCAYEFADRGVQVHMLVRASGHGPMWMCPMFVTPLKKQIDLLITTRAITWMSPCIFGAADGYSRVRDMLHGTTVGRWFVDTFWGILRNDVETLNGYDKHEETAKLKPWTNPFFLGCGLGIVNYKKDFFQFVRDGRIKVHIADITSLSDKTVHLSSGEQLKADALICSTGWKCRSSINFLPPGSDASLGLPHYSEQPNPQVEQADREILGKFPRLQQQPTPNPQFKDVSTDPKDTFAPPRVNQPYRLYRFMIPPAFLRDRSIAFAGVSTSIFTALQAQVQALWLSAYFDGKLDISDDEDEIDYETLLHSRFGRWRYPASVAHGTEYPDMAFDSLPYLDMLLGQLGLKTHRKSGMLKECFQSYVPADYRGLIEEWREVQERNGEK